MWELNFHNKYIKKKYWIQSCKVSFFSLFLMNEIKSRTLSFAVLKYISAAIFSTVVQHTKYMIPSAHSYFYVI